MPCIILHPGITGRNLRTRTTRTCAHLHSTTYEIHALTHTTHIPRARSLATLTQTPQTTCGQQLCRIIRSTTRVAGKDLM